MKITINEFINDGNTSPFEAWFNKLNAAAASKVTTALYRLEYGNFSNVKSVHGGVFEYRINFGPGYRVYFGQDGEEIIILSGGGTKKRQQSDIELAKKYWKEYKQRKSSKR